MMMVPMVVLTAEDTEALELPSDGKVVMDLEEAENILSIAGEQCFDEAFVAGSSSSCVQ